MTGRSTRVGSAQISRQARAWLTVAAALIVAAGCGQTGPLALPERSTAPSGADSGDSAAAPTDSEADDEESTEDER